MVGRIKRRARGRGNRWEEGAFILLDYLLRNSQSGPKEMNRKIFIFVKRRVRMSSDRNVVRFRPLGVAPCWSNIFLHQFHKTTILYPREFRYATL